MKKQIISLILIVSILCAIMPYSVSAADTIDRRDVTNALNALLIGVHYPSEQQEINVAQWKDEYIVETIYSKLLWDSYHYDNSSYLSNIGLSSWYDANDEGYLHFDLDKIQKITRDTLGRDYPSDYSLHYVFADDNELIIMPAIGESITLSVQDFRRQGDILVAVGTAVHNYSAFSEFLGYFQARFEENASSIYGYSLISLEKTKGNCNFSNVTAHASSELKERTQTHYATNALDKNLDTAWVEGVRGVGIDEWIRLESTDGSDLNVSAIEFSLGYQKSKELLEKNGVPRKVLIEYEDGYQQEAEFYAGYDTTVIILDRPAITHWIKISILEASAGTEYDDTCISEIVLKGIDSSAYFLEDTPESDDYARTEWIRQHMEYAASEEFEKDIVRGFDGALNDAVIDVKNDFGNKAYSTLDSVNHILDFDLDLNETQEYELLLAQVFFNYSGAESIEEIYAENMTKVLVMLGEKMLKLDDLKKIADSKELEAILTALKDPTKVEKLNTELNKFFNFADKYDKINLKTGLVTELKKQAFDFPWAVAIDSMDLVTTTLKELLMYVAVGEAYAKTSGAFGDMLLAMRRNLDVPSDNPLFRPVNAKHLLTNDKIWDLTGNNNSPYSDPLNAPVVLKDLAAAIENFYTSIEESQNENSHYLADTAIADLKDGAIHDVLINNSVNAGLQLISCLPIINEFNTVKNVLSTGQSILELMTSIEEEEYLSTMILRLHCLSYLHAVTVDSIAGDSASWNNVPIDLDNYTPGAILTASGNMDLYNHQFDKASTLDEAINVYKSISLVAVDYAIKYYSLLLKTENMEFFPDARDISNYSLMLQMLSVQKMVVNDIRCHSDNLKYDSATNTITYDTSNLSIYTVACPVDVIISTDSGKQIAYLSNNGNQISEGYENYFRSIICGEKDYIKIAVVPENYSVKLQGTGNGIMNAYIANITNNAVEDASGFIGIPITKKSTGYFSDINTSDEMTTHLLLDDVTYAEGNYAESTPTKTNHIILWIVIINIAAIICVVLVAILLKRRYSDHS